MKQRIISGVAMGVVLALVLVLGINVDSMIITIFLSIIAAIGVWELVVNIAGLKWTPFQILPMLYTLGIVPLLSKWLTQMLGWSAEFRSYEQEFSNVLNSDGVPQGEVEMIYNGGEVFLEDLYLPGMIAGITLLYFLVCSVLILIKQSDFDLSKIVTITAMPLFIAFSVATMGSIIISTSNYETGVYAGHGIYYLLLMFNFASVCDMGAYFVGVSMGKTKLCPTISPKKTVEGAIGGIVASIIVGLILNLCYGFYSKILMVALFTIPLCIVGMIGDLFASIIKRKVGVKDYGNLIPGHGGVLDRVDSLLFISPVVYFLTFFGIV